MRKILVVRSSIVAALLVGVLVASTSVQGDTSQVNALKVERDAKGSSSFVISKSGAVEIQDFMMDDPPRLVVDFIGATHEMPKTLFDGDGKFVERVRSSQFTDDPNRVVRVVFDLKGEAQYKLTAADDVVTVQFFVKDAPARPRNSMRVMESSVDPMGLGALMNPIAKEPVRVEEKEANPLLSTQPVPEVRKTPPVQPSTTVRQAPAIPEVTPIRQPTAVQKVPAAAQETVSPRTDNNTDVSQPLQASWKSPSTARKTSNLDAVVPETQVFQSYATSAGMVKNKNITIDVQEADIQTVLRSFSEFSSINIIGGPEVEGTVTAHLNNVPWRQAMDIILKSHGFGYREEYGMIRVSTIEKLTKEELSLQAAERQKDDLLPLETRIVQVNFANAGEMKGALKEILSVRGSMEAERGSNVLVVTDISKNIDRIIAMVEELDRKIRQVEIHAKLVDVDFAATREIGVKWGLLNLASSDVNGVGDFNIDARSASPAGVLRMGTVQSWGEVQAIIDMLEKENKANIISNPRIVTADNREASILVGKQIPLIVSDEAGNPITELTKIGITLRVTPHINSDNTITLDLHPEVSDLSSEATVQGGVIIVMSEADTRVVVRDGETAVIGGLISEVESRLVSGVPILKDIPLLGGLFRLTNDTKKKRELIIFVTPKIIES